VTPLSYSPPKLDTGIRFHVQDHQRAMTMNLETISIGGYIMSATSEENVRLHIARLLLVPFLCCFTVPVVSQNDSPVPQPTDRNERLFQCAEWTRARARLDTFQDLDNLLQSSIEVDWSQWSLRSKDRNEEKLSPAIDPDKIAHSIERRSTIAAALAAFGASMSANTPQKNVVVGPQGTSTVTIYPQPGRVSAAASDAAENTARPGMELASTLSDAALRRTTLFPDGQTGGRTIYFAKPKDNQKLVLEVRIPGLPKFALPVAAK
jgi:hypothetical protein